MRKKLIMAAAAFAVAGLVLSGCSPSSGNNSGGGSDKPLTIAMPNGAITENSNPFLSTAAGSQLGYRWAIYEPVVQFNLAEPSKPGTPWLAEEFAWNDDYTAITFTVRDGAKWSDGEDITADDYVYTFELLRDTPALNVSALPVTDVTDNGDGTVTVGFETSQYVRQQFIYQTFIVPEHVWSKIADPETDVNKTPVGSGPYTLKTWTPQVVTLTARDDYWGGEPPVKTLQYSSFTDNAALTTALTSGQVQWTWTFIPDYENVFIAKDPANHLAWFPAGLGIDLLYVNTTEKPFDDAAVRKAVSMVIDRDKISTQAYSATSPAITSETGLPQPAGDPFISSALTDATYEVDVDGAKKVLADAGYTLDGDKLIDPSGTPVTFSLTNPTGWSDYLASLQIIADSVKPLGIDATVDAQAADPWFDAVAQGNFQATNHWTDTGITPYDIYSNSMNGTFNVPVGESAEWNFGRYDNPKATELLSQYVAATDDAGRQTALDGLQQIFVDDVPAIPTVGRAFGAEFSQKYWKGWPSADNPYAHPQPTQPSVSQVLMSLEANNG
nr:ABC transporter substrate-binding protein [Leifsonia sp. Leaf325]